MQKCQVPGVWIEERFEKGPSPFLTGVPVFLGLVRRQALGDLPRRTRDEKLVLQKLPAPGLWLLRRPGAVVRATDIGSETFGSWPGFEEDFGFLSPYGYLTGAVRGFFENGGSLCYTQVIYFDDAVSVVAALREGLSILRHFDDADLVCAPDIMHEAVGRSGPPASSEVLRMQNDILNHCDRMGNRFAILDSLKGAGATEVSTQRRGLKGANGALYYPWIRTSQSVYVPPCGHMAGVYARSDALSGVHKAPANEALENVLDLEVNVDDETQAMLNPEGINCLRAFPGRGIRVWGARTVHPEEAWKYVNVRRLFITVARWALRFMTSAVFEPHDSVLWARITRELTGYLNTLHRSGAFLGARAREAFFVKCDAENNPKDVRDAGMVIADIGLAAAAPGEFIVVRITHGVDGTDVSLSALQPGTPLVGAKGFEATTRGDVRIIHLEYNPPGPEVSGEFVLIQNNGGASVDVTGWTLSDAAYHTFRFPSFFLGPKGYVRVWTREGMNTATDLYWGRRAAVWNNAGDKAFLRERRGLLVSEFPADS